VTAPAKVILHGEHSVVYGKTALAASVDLRTSLSILPSKSDKVELNLPDLNCVYSWSPAHLLSLKEKLGRHEKTNVKEPESASPEELSILRDFLNSSSSSGSSKATDQGSSKAPDQGVVAFLHLLTSLLPADSSFPLLEFTVTSAIPLGAGLGSSAALSVCFAAGFFLAATRSECLTGALGGDADSLSTAEAGTEELTETERDYICRWAYTAEQVLHGTPSGIDNSVATHGGVVAYRAGAMQPLQDLAGLQVLLTNTGVGRNTKALVEGVRERHRCLPGIVQPVLEAMHQVSEAALATLQECREKQFKGCSTQFQTLEGLVDTNHCLLASLGVSHPALERVRTVTQEQGLHTKLTGAGGGGVAFTLVTPDTPEEQVVAAMDVLKGEGMKCYRAGLGGPGVTVKLL